MQYHNESAISLCQKCDKQGRTGIWGLTWKKHDLVIGKEGVREKQAEERSLGKTSEISSDKKSVMSMQSGCTLFPTGVGMNLQVWVRTSSPLSEYYENIC